MRCDVGGLEITAGCENNKIITTTYATLPGTVGFSTLYEYSMMASIGDILSFV